MLVFGTVSTRRNEGEDGEKDGHWVALLGEGMRPQRRVKWLKAESVRQSLLVLVATVMVACWKAGNVWPGWL